MRKKIVAGNWKMNMDLAEGMKFAGSIEKYFKETPSEKALVILCPPFIHLAGVAEILKHGKEDDKLLNKKTLLALNSGLKVIFCCGEILKEREAAQHFLIVRRQLEEGLFNLTTEQIDMIVIAYEPVWAIGTGLTATPDQAQEMHKYIRDLVKEKYGNDCAKKLPILYGGSCKPSNAKEIFSKPDVDGGLIGGAALKKEDFTAIVEAI